jgi:hypothetical protein
MPPSDYDFENELLCTLSSISTDGFMAKRHPEVAKHSSSVCTSLE